MNWLVTLVTVARAALYIAYAAAIIWLAYATAGEFGAPAAPTATARFGANHLLAPGDLGTPQMSALLGPFFRAPVETGQPVTPAMVSAQPVVPVVPSGIDVVVEIARAWRNRDIQPGRQVQVVKDGQILVDSGTVVAVPCDERRCAVVIGVGKVPPFAASALAGADVVARPGKAITTGR